LKIANPSWSRENAGLKGRTMKGRKKRKGEKPIPSRLVFGSATMPSRKGEGETSLYQTPNLARSGCKPRKKRRTRSGKRKRGERRTGQRTWKSIIYQTTRERSLEAMEEKRVFVPAAGVGEGKEEFRGNGGQKREEGRPARAPKKGARRRMRSGDEETP